MTALELAKRFDQFSGKEWTLAAAMLREQHAEIERLTEALNGEIEFREGCQEDAVRSWNENVAEIRRLDAEVKRLSETRAREEGERCQE